MLGLFDKAQRYARDVTSGKEITTKEVKIQCEWFLEDLKKQDNDSFKYYLDKDELEVVEGILQLLNFATGLGVIGNTVLEGLVDFQAFFYAMYSVGDLKIILKSLDTETIHFL